MNETIDQIVQELMTNVDSIVNTTIMTQTSTHQTQTAGLQNATAIAMNTQANQIMTMVNEALRENFNLF